MQEFVKHFTRGSNGAWRCVADVEINHIMGHIQVAKGALFPPGTVIMGVDIVLMLEEASTRLNGSRRPLSQSPLHT